MSSTALPGLEVVKWYTRARKFPQLIGRTPDGARIPGGPYTFVQVIAAGLMLLVGVNTMGWWARYGLIANALLLLSVTYGLVLLLGRIPPGSRNPLSICAGLSRALTAPPTGRLAGRPIKLRPPRQVRHNIVLLTTPTSAGPAGHRPTATHQLSPQATAAPPQQRAAPPRAPEVPTRLAPALTGVQALLASTATSSTARLEKP